MASAALVLLIVIIVLAVILLLYVVGARNRIIRLDNDVDNSWAQIDVQLKRRADLIPNLVETVKGYAAHEKGVLEGVTQARSALVSAKSPEDANAANNVLTQALGRLFAVAEAYPQLKANENFLQLQDELTHTENKVSFARQHYNDVVLSFNNAVTTFPGSLFASSMGKAKKPMLEIPPADREVPKVKFG
jgi:LemA protein